MLMASLAFSMAACSVRPGGAVGAVAEGNGNYVINLGHTNGEGDSWHQAALRFKDYVEEKSQGRMQVNVYPDSQLGTEIDMIQSILTQNGCDITFTGESMQTYQPDLGIIGMPYLIKSDAHMEAVLTGDVGKELEGLMEKCGMKVLGYFIRGPRNVTANKKVVSPGDMDKFVIRTPQSAMTVAAFRSIGAKPTPMALTQVYDGLQQGVIEGQENPLAMVWHGNFYEVQDYVIRTEHLRGWVYIAMGKEKFDALPSDLQQIVVEGGREMQRYEHRLFLEKEEELEHLLAEEGMEFVDVDQEAFAREMTAGVIDTLTYSQKALYEKIEAVDPDL